MSHNNTERRDITCTANTTPRQLIPSPAKTPTSQPSRPSTISVLLETRYSSSLDNSGEGSEAEYDLVGRKQDSCGVILACAHTPNSVQTTQTSRIDAIKRNQKTEEKTKSRTKRRGCCRLTTAAHEQKITNAANARTACASNVVLDRQQQSIEGQGLESVSPPPASKKPPSTSPYDKKPIISGSNSASAPLAPKCGKSAGDTPLVTGRNSKQSMG